jgi:hypothetical protein
VEKQGFRRLLATGVVLEVNQKAKLDFVLLVGGTTDALTVVAEVPPLQVEDASVGYRLDRPAIEALPLEMRNVVSLLTLGPGAIPRQLGGFSHDVVNDIQQGSRGSVALNPPVNGSRSTGNAFLLDGAADTDRNTYAIAVYPPMDSVQEFRIHSSLAPPEFPQAGGGAMDVVTRSGGKEFHGGAFEYFRNESADAHNFFDDPFLPRPIFRQSQFGGSAGGPAGLRETYFFASYEGVRGKSAKPALSIVPGANLRAGDFSGANPIFDPMSLDAATGARAPFPGNRIPDSRIDSAATKYLNSFEPLPNRSAGSANYLDTTPNENTTDNASFRLDHQFPDQSRIFGRYTLNREHDRIAGAFPLLPASERVRAQQAAIGYTFAGAAWVHEAHVSFTRLRLFDVPESAFRTNVAGDLGLDNAPSDPFAFGLPSFIVTNFSLVTDDPALPQVQRDNLWHFAYSSSRTSGRHTWKAGFDGMHFTMAYLQSRLARGEYTYTGSFTALPGSSLASGDPFADFLLGFPQSTSRNAGNTQAYLRQNTFAGYLQDDWRVSSSLTFNFGFRYEYFAPFTEDRGSLLNLDYSGLPAPPSLAAVSRAVRPDRNNIAPRAGAAWQFGRDTVFRAGYGIYYSPEIAVETYDLTLNRLRNEVNQTSGSGAPLLTTRNAFPRTASTGLPSYFGMDPAARTPYVQQWTAGVQHELPGRIMLEAAYVGTKGTALGRFRRFNTPLHVVTGENLPPRDGDLQSLRPFPGLGMIIQRQHIANSIYHSLQVKADKRFSRHLGFLASFVWSKSIDDADSVVPGLFESFGAQDERNLRLERGLSFFNVGRRVSAGVVYELPRAQDRLRILRNWQASAILTLQDGTPVNPVYFAFDPANSGTPNRPDIVPGQSITLPRSQRTADRFFNTDAFRAPAEFHFGNAGRNIIQGPGNNVLDIALDRRFVLSERQSLQFRVEAFNVFNHPNWGIPGPYPDFGPFFGKIFSTGEPRRMQFALRYRF